MNIAVVFPGQGSQYVGMLAGYVDDWPVVLDTFKEASDVLGYDLWDVVSNGPEEKLIKLNLRNLPCWLQISPSCVL